jgi:heme/copper-type cytochrome/quinol oxidase subunit 4
MSKIMKGILGFALGFLLTTIMFWLGGFDFNERGAVAVVWLTCSLTFGWFGYCIIW